MVYTESISSLNFEEWASIYWSTCSQFKVAPVPLGLCHLAEEHDRWPMGFREACGSCQASSHWKKKSTSPTEQRASLWYVASWRKKKIVDARVRLKRVAIRSVKFALHFNGLSPFPFNYFERLSPWISITRTQCTHDGIWPRGHRCGVERRLA